MKKNIGHLKKVEDKSVEDVVLCPRCGSKNLFPLEGWMISGVDTTIFRCEDCKKKFEVEIKIE